MYKIPIIKGAKGGKGSSHTPVEAKESGHSRQQMDFVEVISEGEIWGLVDDMKSIYLDKTPVANKDGSFNFKNISFQGTVGTQDQEIMKGFSSAQREINVGVEVKYNKPVIKTVTDKNVTDLRLTLGVRALFKQETNGDTNGTSVSFTIQIGTKTYTHTFNGKYSAGAYLESLEITDLPPVPFNITVSRNEPDSSSQRLQNGTIWSSYTEIINDGYAYPNTAVMGVSIDSEYFSNVPQRNYLVRGLLINIPDIYDPITRKYSSDFWSGAFKRGWTNNPVWIWYDLVTNKRYGMGKSLSEFNVDKFQLFAIARYCDELVPDGYGGTEPRMTCNVWLTEQKQAYELVQSLASVFRAMPIWNGQALTAVQDRAQDPVWKYTNANVVDGMFTYSRSARKARHNTVQVEWVNPDDFYNTAIEQVTDDDSIRKYGQNITKVTAFGCTSRGQAARTARWILETEKLETETVTFTVGAEGLMHLPYDIIEVADNQFAGTNVGGRIKQVINETTFKLDRDIEIQGETYISVIGKNGEIKRDKVLVAQNEGTIQLQNGLRDIEEFSIWTLETARVTTGLYRCVQITENNTDGTYTITALQHIPEKEDIVINGTYFEPKPRTIYSTVGGITVDYDGKKTVIKGQINRGSDNTGNEDLSYDIRILKNGAVILNSLGLKSPTYSMDDLENGDYVVIIIIKDSKGRILSQKEHRFTIDRPPIVTGIEITGGMTDVTLEWNYINDITDTEIWCSEQDNLQSAVFVARVNSRLYSHKIGSEQTRYYWLRHVRGVNTGSFDQVKGRKATTLKDLNKQLDELNKDLSKNIVNEIIDTALPARNLDFTLTVKDIGNVAQYRGHKNVYNEKDGKLYTWNGSKYESGATEILAGAIKGIIQPNQLASIPTSKISGTLDINQIPNLSASKITGTLGIAQIPSVPTTKLTGTLSANLFQANSIGANLLQAGAVGTNHLQANSINGSKLQANSVGTNALQANSIASKHLQANSVVSATISAGAIRANHLAVAEITADKFASGLGGNLLYNPIFANNGYGWTISNGNYTGGTIARNYIGQGTADFTLKNSISSEERMVKLQFTETITTPKNQWADVIRQKIRLIPNQWYMFSAYTRSYRCGAFLLIEELNASGGYVRAIASKRLTNAGNFAQGVDSATRNYVKFRCPTSGYVEVMVRADNQTGNNPDVYVARPMLEECTEHTKEPSVWVNAGVTSIHGGSIVSKTITAQQIKANSITGNEIAANTIVGNHIAANTITGNKLVGKTVTADKINVNNLSALSANLGSITAGALKIGSLNGNYGTMFEIMSNGGFRLISRDSSGGIELSSSTRALTVWNGGTEAVKVGKLN